MSIQINVSKEEEEFNFFLKTKNFISRKISGPFEYNYFLIVPRSSTFEYYFKIFDKIKNDIQS